MRAMAFLLVSIASVTLGAAEAHAHTTTTSPDGCCVYTMEHCVARPGHPRAECQAGHRFLDYSNECAGVGCIGEGSGCQPDIATGSVAEVANGVDDDCDGFVDDEQCDGVDNDDDGMIDEDLGSCLMTILFVPLCWSGTIGEFQNAAASQLITFQNSAGVGECLDNFSATVLDLDDNLPCIECDVGCGVDEVAQAIRGKGIDTAGFDVVAALTDEDICGSKAGCNSGDQVLWLEADYPTVLAHELGHSLSLGDEYCSLSAGSDCENCNSGADGAECDGAFCPAPPNYLGTDLGCDPEVGDCCGDCSGDEVCKDDYQVCCEGNRAAGFENGRCIMSYANAADPRAYCERCGTHIASPPFPRSEDAPGGQVPMDCAFSHLGSESVLSVEMEVSQAGAIAVRHADIAIGRLGLGGTLQDREFFVTVEDDSGAFLASTSIDVPAGYTDPRVSGVDYSALVFPWVTRSFRVPIPDSVEDTEPLRITLSRGPVVMWQTTLGGAAPVANAGPDRFVECVWPGGALVMLDGSDSFDTDGDSLGYEWEATGSDGGIPLDDPSSATPSGQFPIGASVVTLGVTDGVFDSVVDVADVVVGDTEPPSLTLAATPTTLWSPNHKMVPISVDVAIEDLCDPAPSFFLKSITSSEPDNGTGDGDTANDIQEAEFGSADVHFKLRAERAGAGGGRTYTITYTAVDSHGNSADFDVLVHVPHNQ